MRTDPQRWQIKELEEFFSNVELPESAKIYNFRILGVEKFVESHLAFIKHNAQKMAFKGYYERLMELKKVLTNNQNNKK